MDDSTPFATDEPLLEGGASGFFCVHFWYTHHHGAYKGHHHPHRGSHKPRPGARHKRGPEKHPRKKGLHHHHRGVHEHHHVIKGHKHPHKGSHVHHRSHAEILAAKFGGAAAPAGVVMQGAINAPVNRSLTERDTGVPVQ